MHSKRNSKVAPATNTVKFSKLSIQCQEGKLSGKLSVTDEQRYKRGIASMRGVIVDKSRLMMEFVKTILLVTLSPVFLILAIHCYTLCGPADDFSCYVSSRRYLRWFSLSVGATTCSFTLITFFQYVATNKHFDRSYTLMEKFIICFVSSACTISCCEIIGFLWYPIAPFGLLFYLGTSASSATVVCCCIFITEFSYVEDPEERRIIVRTFIGCCMIAVWGVTSWCTYILYGAGYQYLQQSDRVVLYYVYALVGLGLCRLFNHEVFRRLFNFVDPSTFGIGESFLFYLHGLLLSNVRGASIQDPFMMFVLSISDICNTMYHVLYIYWGFKAEQPDEQYLSECATVIMLEELLEITINITLIVTYAAVYWLPAAETLGGIKSDLYGYQELSSIDVFLKMMCFMTLLEI